MVAVGGVNGVSARMVMLRTTRLSEIHSKVVAVLASKQRSSFLPNSHPLLPLLAQTILPCSDTFLTIQRRNTRQPPHSSI